MQSIQLEQVLSTVDERARRGGRLARKAIRIRVRSARGVESRSPIRAGIPPPRAKIFDPSSPQEVKGHGLGLSITYGIVKEHGGTISS